MKRYLWAMLSAVFLFAAPASYAWESVSPDLAVACSQDPPAGFKCDYRLPGGGSASEISARSGDRALPIVAPAAYPWSGALTAVYIIVDTSDPGRQAVIDRNIAHVEAIVTAAGPQHLLGLATFDSELRELAPIGSPPDVIRRAVASLRAVGMTTELYRSQLQAVDALARIQADRRALVVFSDGQPEDRAYFHDDVVRAARRAGVVINTLGFPRSVALSVALQTLRRLSEETGGVYIDTEMNFALPPDFATRILAGVNSGGRFGINAAGAAGEEIRIEFRTPRGTFSAAMPVAPAAAAPAASVPAAATAARAVPEVRVITTATERDTLDTWLWYGIPAALIVLIVLTAVTLVLIYRKPGPRGAQALTAVPDIKPLAYLIAQDERATRYPIRNTIWRIGRSRDNELVLDDNSISRRHAEIQRGTDGGFVLLDKDSLNGVFVNGEKVGRRELKEGDILEIGDVFLRFTEAPADDQMIERTSMQHTRAPRVV
jgi:hypothetical protein